MAYIPEGAPCAGRIRTVTFGTGEGAITLGGQNAMPLYGFDAPFANPPRAGIAVTDLPPENLPVVEMNLNRPFLFVIRQGDVPLFIGTVQTLEA